MKILLKNRENGLFYESPGRWTSDVNDAREFSSALMAYHFSVLNSWDHAEIVFIKDGKPLRPVLQKSFPDFDRFSPRISRASEEIRWGSPVL